MISVIIPTFNRNQILCNTLNSVLYEKGKFNGEVEVIVVDQTPNHSNEVAAYLQEKSKDGSIILIKEAMPSLPNARNQGIRISKGEIILFLDDDIILSDGFFSALINAYDNPQIDSVVGGVTLVNESGENQLLQNQSKLKGWVRTLLLLFIGKNKAFVISDFGFVLSNTNSKRASLVDGGRGCNMSFRKRVFDKIGLFDVNYLGNALREETDMFYRLKRNNMHVFYSPSIHLNHIMANSGGCRNDTDEKYWSVYFYNQCYFYIKNFHFTYSRIRLLLFFDYLKCKKAGLNIKKIMFDSYQRAQKNCNK